MAELSIETAPVFVPLLEPARYKGAHGGRGSGKSHNFAEMLVEQCLMIPGSRMVCVREVQRSLKESVKRLVEDKIDKFGVGGHFRIMSDSIVAPGGGVILFQGMADHTAESIKSLEGFDVAYVEEAQTMSSRSLEMLRPTIRGSARMRQLDRQSEIWFSWNPRNENDPVDRLLRGSSIPKNAVVVQANWRDNPWFPEELEDERQFDYLNNPQRYEHIWEGGYEPQAIGAIWTKDVIERNRRDNAPEMGRILIGVDPPSESPDDVEHADRCGLVAGGIGVDGRGYLLQDESQQASPEEWARMAIAMYDQHEADAIVAETNMGGDMVRSVIHAVRPGIKVIKVRAKRGKHLRAEPISSLYSLNRISHVGSFPEIERQYCLTTPSGYQGSDSPDNMDAAVYVFTELFSKMIREPRPTHNMPQRANNRYDPHRI